MKKVYIILSFMFLALGCSHEDITTPLLTDAPPVNHAKRTASPKARLAGCSNAYCAFYSPSAINSLYGTYATLYKPNTTNLYWYTSSNQPNSYGYFPVATDPTLTISLYGPAPNYPLAYSFTVANNNSYTFSSGTTLGYYQFPIYSTLATGWYYFLIETGTDNNCRNSAVDVYIKDF